MRHVQDPPAIWKEPAAFNRIGGVGQLDGIAAAGTTQNRVTPVQVNGIGRVTAVAAACAADFD